MYNLCLTEVSLFRVFNFFSPLNSIYRQRVVGMQRVTNCVSGRVFYSLNLGNVPAVINRGNGVCARLHKLCRLISISTLNCSCIQRQVNDHKEHFAFQIRLYICLTNISIFLFSI